MPWGRLDDQANGNAKLLALSDAAWRMWGCALIYCQANLTDGFIPECVIVSFGVRAKNKAKVVDELCTALVPGRGPLWYRTDGGFQVHDYLVWNDSREKVEKERLTGKQRLALFQNPELRAQIRARDGDWCRYCHGPVRWTDRKGELGGTYDHVLPYGGNSLENLVVACRSCNSRKGGRTPEEASMCLLESFNEKSRSQSRLLPATTTTTTDGGSKEQEPPTRARELARVAHDGPRLRIPHWQHEDLGKRLGAKVNSFNLLGWYGRLETELERTGESFADPWKWLQARLYRDAQLPLPNLMGREVFSPQGRTVPDADATAKLLAERRAERTR